MTLYNGINTVVDMTAYAAPQTTMGLDFPTEIVHLKENQIIFAEGQMPQGLYLLKTGAAKVIASRPVQRGRMTSPEFVSKIVAPGEFFGFKALLKGAPQAVTAKTLRPSEIQIFSKKAIDGILNGPSSIMKSLLLQMVRDLESFENNSQLHYLASVQERIAYQLVLLADKFGVSTSDGVSISLKLSRNELAQLAGTINESLSRHLTELRDEGVIDLRGKDIVIKNRMALAERSGNFA